MQSNQLNTFIRDPAFGLGCSRKALLASLVTFYGSALTHNTTTKDKWWFNDLGSLLIALALQRSQTAPVVSGDDF